MTKLQKSWLIIGIVLLIDQTLKIWIKTTMMIGEEIRVFDWFYILFLENPGMAFGLELGGQHGKLFLSLFRIAAAIGIGWYITHLVKKNAPTGLIVCLSLVLAGAIGNILDSAFYGILFDASYGRVATFLPAGGGYAPFLHGNVVDMFYFPLIRGTYPEWLPFLGGDNFIFFRPVFNIADASITTGVFTILIFQKRFFPEHLNESAK